jgi:predicted secreted protein
MTVAGVEHSISPALRRKVEAKLATEAIGLFREKGNVYAEAFGAKGGSLIQADVRVGGGYRGGKMRSVGASMMALSASAAPMVEEEGGKETLQATVTGSIQLVR